MNNARRTNAVKLKIDHRGGGTVDIGGHKLEHYCAGIQVISIPGEMPKIVLNVIATEGLQAELDALVDVEVRHIHEAASAQ